MTTKRAFILDDDQDVLDVISGWLDDLGLAAAAYSSAEPFMQALDQTIASHSEPALLVLDLRLPEIDGLDVVHLLAERRFRGPILILSGVSNDLIHGARVLALSLGLNIVGSINKNQAFERFAELVCSAVQLPRFPEISLTSIRYVYQPIFTRERKLEGVEGLIRINGLSPNAEQLAVLEVSDPSQQQLFWQATLTNTLEDWRGWNEPSLGLTLNLSPAVMGSAVFQADLLDALTAYRFPHNRLTLELTERAGIADPCEILRAMCKLRLHGINLALDDFGRAYSTIERLRTLPFSQLKLDRSLIQDQAPPRTGSPITLDRAVALAKGLQMRLVAEGIETQSEFQRACAAGADLLQGYYLAHPMSADSIASLLAESDGIAAPPVQPQPSEMSAR